MSVTRLMLTGDTIITQRISKIRDPALLELAELLRSADTTIANLEIVAPGKHREPSTAYHGIPLFAEPQLFSELAWLGFDLVGMANNHATDFGPAGLASTMDELDRIGIPYAGVGRTLRQARAPTYFDTGHRRVALIAAGSTNARLGLAADPGADTSGRPGIAPVRVTRTHYLSPADFDALREILARSGVDVYVASGQTSDLFFPYPDKGVYEAPPEGAFAFQGAFFAPSDSPRTETTALERDVVALEAEVRGAAKQADIVVMSVHGHEGAQGAWNGELPAEFMQPFARRMIDAGASAIGFHGPHTLRGVEIYDGRPICYSLGNFIFNLEGVEAFPSEYYEQVGLDQTSRPSDVYDKMAGFSQADHLWEGIVADLKFEDGVPPALNLHPVILRRDVARGRRGYPTLADKEKGRAILETVSSLSTIYGTLIKVSEDDRYAVGRAIV